MKQCKQCAEEIQSDAKKCRYCGADQRFGRSAGGTVKNAGCAVIVAIILVLFISSFDEDEQPAAKILTDGEVQICQDIIDEAVEKGIVTESALGGDLIVEDSLFRALPYDSKVSLVGAQACVRYRVKPTDTNGYQHVFARGYRSGKILGSIGNGIYMPE